jgi:hypothetical protein
MACSYVADGGDGFQIWKVAANIFNKQLQTADRGGPPVLGLGMGLTTPHSKKQDSYKMSQKASDLNRFFG